MRQMEKKDYIQPQTDVHALGVALPLLGSDRSGGDPGADIPDDAKENLFDDEAEDFWSWEE